MTKGLSIIKQKPQKYEIAIKQVYHINQHLKSSRKRKIVLTFMPNIFVKVIFEASPDYIFKISLLKQEMKERG